ncbi:MAG: LPS export ABC transporter permease LptG [Burkholderiales bacterium]|nr:LPS export ABC transporter permease LptG [Burkholderiales bacterium]
MKTVRRLLYRDIVASVAFVAAAFLSLFFFIDFVDALDGVGRNGRTIGDAVLATLLEVPGHFYELLPISVLIGAIYALARMAQSSEYTILRTSGLAPTRALSLLAVLGVGFGLVTFVTGDFVAPACERESVLLQARTGGGLKFDGSGAWLKEKRRTPEGERNYSVNVAGASAGGELVGIRIFGFDADGGLRQRIQAAEGHVGSDGTWTLRDAEVTDWPRPDDPDPRVSVRRVPSLAWPSTLTASVVAAAVLPLSTMSTLELWRYSAHLSDQEQATQPYRIRFWRKALYPLACLVMVALALPFAYLHARAGSVSLKVFGGVMLGISFVLLNNLSGHIGMLRGWTPWVAAATPSLLYLLLSMGAFAWLVRYR